jgi:asparagine synthetase B (glutamine-hydrolysing)
MNVLLLLVLVSALLNVFIALVVLKNYIVIGSGAQPIVSDDEDLILSVNGEIYNHKQLRRDLKGDHVFKTESDCEVIMHMVS